MKRFLRDNSLSIFFGIAFLLALFFQAVAGRADYSQQQIDHGGHAVSLLKYVTTSDFANAVTENWQSEFLQFTLFILVTVWLVQRGSPESKPLDEDPEPTPRGIGARLYSHSLTILMAAIWIACWFAQSVSGWNVYNTDQAQHHGHSISWLSYLGTSGFWEATLQNWQSEFLAVGAMAVFAIYLRERGSPESKAVGAPDEATGT